MSTDVIVSRSSSSSAMRTIFSRFASSIFTAFTIDSFRIARVRASIAFPVASLYGFWKPSSCW